jgi:uncharacterized protein YggE
MKRSLAAAAIGGALVAALTLGGVFSPGGAHGASPPAGAITATGNGSSTVVPDRASFTFGVSSNAATAAAALSASSDAADRVVAALQKAGVAKADLQTSDVSLSPRTSENGDKILGYTASVSVAATVRKLASAGAVVDAAVGAGANQVSGPNLLVSDESSAYRAALKDAIADARAKAQTLASASGLTLGAVTSVTEGSAPTPVPLFGPKEAAGATPPVEPGTQEVDASVTMVFATG